MKSPFIKRNLTVVIPSYNSGSWLLSTIPKISESIKEAEISNAEIIVVHDGSTDESVKIVKDIKCLYPVRSIMQKNMGRFMARKNGIEQAKYDTILLIDTRVFIDRDSLSYVFNKVEQNPERIIWNGHVNVDKRSNIFARFWDAIVHIGWRRYFANPRDCSYGIDEFDYYPKGTGCFLAPREVLTDAMEEFLTLTKDLKNSSDDTLLIKSINRHHRINLSPNFSCTYHSRSTLRQFIIHAYNRGKFFVDGFLRMDGNRYFWLLLAFLFISILVPIFAVLFPQHISYIIGLVLLGWIAEFIIALLLRVPFKDSASLFILTPLFVATYGSGIWSATLRRLHSARTS